MEIKKNIEKIARDPHKNFCLSSLLISLLFLSSCGFFDGGVTYGVERGTMAACGSHYITNIDEKGIVALVIADRRFPIDENGRIIGFDVDRRTGELVAGGFDLNWDGKEDRIVGSIKDGVATFQTVCSESDQK